MILEVILFFLMVYNISSVIICIFDKYQAKKGGRRVSEATLFALSILGGAVGMYITMRIIRHKTLHKRFMMGLPLIIILQLMLCYVFVDSGAYMI